MPEKILKIIIAGEGGQGVQKIAQILSYACFLQNLEILYIPNFGVEQRGGVSLAFIQVSKEPIPFPKFGKADILVVLNQRSLERTKRYLDKQTRVIYNSSLVSKSQICPSAKKNDKLQIRGIKATEIANREFNPRVFNMIILGSLVNLISQKEKDLAPKESLVKKAIEKELGYKFKEKPELRQLNLKAFNLGKRYEFQS